MSRREVQPPKGVNIRCEKVLAVMRQYPQQSLNIVQIAERAQLHTSTVTVALQRLAANGDVKRVNGTPPRWTLLRPPPPPRRAA